MREIKFRALAGVGKTWFYWDVYGDYPQGVYGGLSEPQQYTGLKDMIDIMPSDATYPYQRLKVTGNVNEQIHEWMTNAP